MSRAGKTGRAGKREGFAESGRRGKAGRQENPEMRDKDSMEWLADRLRVPTEVLAGAPVFILNGKHQVWVENYKSILEYEDNQIRLLTRQGRVRIWGKLLAIDEFTKDGMRIVGRISGVEFLSESEP